MQKLALTENPFPDDITRDLREASAILQDYGAQKIILYGSLARGNYRADSDIDICVEGLPDQHYFRAFAECLMGARRRISVLDLRNIRGYFRERILDEGKILYEREGVSL